MAPMQSGLELDGISKSFGGTSVLGDVTLSVRRGEFLSLVGASGCGKSTLLRIIAGLEHPDAGRVAINGRDVSALEPSARDVAMVFQSYALYPHMTAGANIATPLTMARLTPFARLPLLGRLAPGRPRAMVEIAEEVRAVAEQLQIGGLLDRKPAQLSGGQRQRVALARAMVRRPAAFLMDEPLSNLDAKLRVHMRGELTELHRRLGATFVYVTHDQTEAMTMSDRIALMAGGRILQLGTPTELYDAPASLQVAQFIGSPAINCLPATCDRDGRVICMGRIVPRLAVHGGRNAATLAVRPEALRVDENGDGFAFPAVIRRIEHHGAERILLAEAGDAPGTLLHARLDAARAAGLGEGATVEFGFRPEAAHLFDADGHRLAPAAAATAPARALERA